MNATRGNDDLKHSCRAAFTVVSILGGSAQLVSLLMAWPAGWVSDRSGLRLGRMVSAVGALRVLLFASVIGTLSATILAGTAAGWTPARSSGAKGTSYAGDPLHILPVLAACGLGAAQMSATVASMALLPLAQHSVPSSSLREASERSGASDGERDGRSAEQVPGLNPASMASLYSLLGSGGIVSLALAGTIAGQWPATSWIVLSVLALGCAASAVRAGLRTR